MMINFQAAFLSFPPSNIDSPVSVLCRGILFSLPLFTRASPASEGRRTNGSIGVIALIVESVDSRRRRDSEPGVIVPAGEEARRLVNDDPKKLAPPAPILALPGLRGEEGERGDAGPADDVGVGEIMFSCSLMSLIWQISFIMSFVILNHALVQ